MTKAKTPAAPAQPMTAAQKLETAIHAAVTEQRQDLNKLAHSMNYLAQNLMRRAAEIRHKVDAGVLDQPLVMRMGEVQGQGPEIDLMCRQVCEQAEYLQTLQYVYNCLTAEQDAARLALAVVGEVAAAQIELESLSLLSSHEQRLEQARAELTHGEIEDILERRAQAEADEYYGG